MKIAISINPLNLPEVHMHVNGCFLYISKRYFNSIYEFNLRPNGIDLFYKMYQSPLWEAVDEN